MPEIDLSPVSRPGAPAPDVLTAGPERPGEDPPERRHWWLPARWRGRPVPRGLVAVVSAVVAGAAVAAYLDPAEKPAPAVEPAPLLAPESWLDVQRAPYPRPEENSSRADRSRWRQAIAAHPADAALVLPLPVFQPQLTGLPPGSYRVRASCALGEVPEWVPLPEPVEFTVDIREPIRPSALLATLQCDSTVQVAPERLEVGGYQAFFSAVSFSLNYAEDLEQELYWSVEEADPVVVVSFSRA